jgi:hypothetical protein
VIPQDVGSIILGEVESTLPAAFPNRDDFRLSLFSILMAVYLLNNTGEKQFFDTLNGKRK